MKTFLWSKENLLRATALAAALAAGVTGMTAANAGAEPAEFQQVPPADPSSKIASLDLFHLRDATDPQIAPDGKHVLFTVQCRDRIGAPYMRIFIADIATGTAKPWGDAQGIEGARCDIRAAGAYAGVYRIFGRG